MEQFVTPTYDELERYIENLQKQCADAQAQIETLQRERDHAKKMEAVQKEIADNRTWHVRELREQLTQLQALVREAVTRWQAQINAKEGLSFRMAMNALAATLDATRHDGCISLRSAIGHHEDGV